MYAVPMEVHRQPELLKTLFEVFKSNLPYSSPTFGYFYNFPDQIQKYFWEFPVKNFENSVYFQAKWDSSNLTSEHSGYHTNYDLPFRHLRKPRFSSLVPFGTVEV